MTVRISPSDKFKRKGLDVYSDVPISFAKAILGGLQTVPTLTGSVEIKVKIFF